MEYLTKRIYHRSNQYERVNNKGKRDLVMVPLKYSRNRNNQYCISNGWILTNGHFYCVSLLK